MVTVGRKELATLSCSRPFGCSLPCSLGFPGGSVVKNPPAVQEMQKMWVCSLGWEDALEKEVLPLQCSCLGNPMDRGAWHAI